MLKKEERRVKVEDAVEKLRGTLKSDKDLYYGYQSNIAMAFHDEAIRQGIVSEKLHEICNNAAKNFLNVFIK